VVVSDTNLGFDLSNRALHERDNLTLIAGGQHFERPAASGMSDSLGGEDTEEGLHTLLHAAKT
jgi:hypothetical protein